MSAGQLDYFTLLCTKCAVQFTSCTAFLTIFPHLSHCSAGLKARCTIKCTIFIHSSGSLSLCTAVMTNLPPSPHGVIEQHLILQIFWLQVEKLNLQTCLTPMGSCRLCTVCRQPEQDECVCERTGRVTLCVCKWLWVKVGWEKNTLLNRYIFFVFY